MKLKLKNGTSRTVCDECGVTANSKDEYEKGFNVYDSNSRGDYCLKCHPRRMTFMQLIEWLAKGNGFVCMQGDEYKTHIDFRMGENVTINGKMYDGKRIDDQIPYDEYNLIVRYFDDSKNKEFWNIPTYEMWLNDCRGKVK